MQAKAHVTLIDLFADDFPGVFTSPTIFRFTSIAHIDRQPAGTSAFHDHVKGFVMTTGTVKWFNATKGFGFIEVEGGGNDVFVHISAVERAGISSIAEGQKVEFEVTQDSRSGKTSADQLKLL